MLLSARADTTTNCEDSESGSAVRSGCRRRSTSGRRRRRGAPGTPRMQTPGCLEFELDACAVLARDRADDARGERAGRVEADVRRPGEERTRRSRDRARWTCTGRTRGLLRARAAHQPTARRAGHLSSGCRQPASIELERDRSNARHYQQTAGIGRRCPRPVCAAAASQRPRGQAKAGIRARTGRTPVSPPCRAPDIEGLPWIRETAGVSQPPSFAGLARLLASAQPDVLSAETEQATGTAACNLAANDCGIAAIVAKFVVAPLWIAHGALMTSAACRCFC